MFRSKSQVAIIGLALAGIGVSGYLTWYELVVPVGVCPINMGYISCSAALTSQYSRIAGIPVAFLGLAWFIGAALLGIMAASRVSAVKVLVAWSGVALIGVIVLVSTEVLVLGELCPFCTVAHLLGLGIVALSIKQWLKAHRASTLK
jgi:uncharacterized membrane protein